MKDTRIATFDVMIARRRRLDGRLNAMLAGQRAEHAELDAQTRQRRAALDEQHAKLEQQQERLKEMVSGAVPVVPRDYSVGMQYRDVLDERRRALESEWRQAHAALDAKGAEIARTISEIRVNQTRIDLYEERIAAMRRDAERCADEMQDEEAQESRRVRAAGGAR